MRWLGALFIAWLLTGTTEAARPAPADFRSVAAIEGAFAPNTPVCVPLSPEVIAEARDNFADVRVFDDLGQETPYVIYRQSAAHQAPESFAFEIVSYDDAADADEITLKRPDAAPAFREIELVIAGADFKKHVQVSAGPAPDAMQQIATDTIFDFSSRLDLRRTTVALPETDSAFLRIRLREEARAPADAPEMRLRYEGLEFWTAGTGSGPFRVERILGWSGARKPTEHFFDHVTLESPAVVVGEGGSSVIRLERKLPVARITFDIENPYYHRRVQFLTATRDRDQEYRVAATGIIYKMPGMAESVNTIAFNQPARDHQLRILNEDNPPLRVRSIKIAWVRRNLYFVPESGRRYTLYIGSDVVAAPRYELHQLIPSNHAQLRHYASMSLRGLRPNTGYDPKWQPTTRQAVEKALFVGLMVLLVGALGVWTFRLLKKMPAQAEE